MNWLAIFLLTLGAVLGLYLSANAVDGPFYVHTLIFAAACVLGIFVVVRHYFDNLGRERSGYNDAIVKAGVVASMFWAVVGLLVGVYIALELAFPVFQRTCRARLVGVLAPWFVFWGYQLFLVLAASGYVMGVTEGREYAEPE